MPRKDVLPLLIDEVADTFLVTRDAHRLICLQDPSGAASFLHEVHWLPMTVDFEGLGHRAF
jgi:hypothetical protein